MGPAGGWSALGLESKIGYYTGRNERYGIESGTGNVPEWEQIKGQQKELQLVHGLDQDQPPLP